MQVFANRPPGTLWVPAFVLVAEAFTPAAARPAAKAAGYHHQARLRGLPPHKTVTDTRQRLTVSHGYAIMAGHETRRQGDAEMDFSVPSLPV